MTPVSELQVSKPSEFAQIVSSQQGGKSTNRKVATSDNDSTHDLNDPSCKIEHNNASIQKYAIKSLSPSEQMLATSSKKELSDLIFNNLDPFFSCVPSCGRFYPNRFLHVMHCLSDCATRKIFPNEIIGVGSGQAFIEKCFSLMNGISVRCYDREPNKKFLPVENAFFPKDIKSCLPNDCSECVLVSGYPQGYLGPILCEFIIRNGKMLCTTVEGSLFCDMHESFEEDPSILRRAINDLRKKNHGSFFQVKLTEYTMIGPPSYIQFYNWPAPIMQAMSDSETLKELCSKIEFDEISSDSEESTE